MPQQSYVILDEHRRRLALRGVQMAPEGVEVTIDKPKRDLEQNKHLHGLVGQIADQMTDPGGTGEFRSLAWWKPRLTLTWLIEKKQEYEIITAFNSHEFGILIPHTSDLKVDQCAEFIEWMYAFGVLNGVKFKDPDNGPEPPPPETDR